MQLCRIWRIQAAGRRTTMQDLDTMQDSGGCVTVLSDLKELLLVAIDHSNGGSISCARSSNLDRALLLFPLTFPSPLPLWAISFFYQFTPLIWFYELIFSLLDAGACTHAQQFSMACFDGIFLGFYILNPPCVDFYFLPKTILAYDWLSDLLL